MAQGRRVRTGILTAWSYFPSYVGLRILAGVVMVLPPRALDALATLLGHVAYALDFRHRRVAMENLDLAYGAGLDRSAKARLIRGHFRHLALCGMEMIRTPHMLRAETLDKHIAVEGEEHLRAAVSQGRGVLIVTAHLGNWEWIGLWLSAHGYKIHAVARALDNPWLDAWVVRRRSAAGQEVLYKKGALRDMLRVLAAGELVGILIDQNERVEPIFVDFFGHPASVNRGAASVAQKTGAAVVMTFDRREGRVFRHCLVFEPPMYAREDLPRKEAVLELTERMTRRIETAVRACPEQWLWVHRRWKTQPGEEENQGDNHESTLRSLRPEGEQQTRN